MPTLSVRSLRDLFLVVAMRGRLPAPEGDRARLRGAWPL